MFFALGKALGGKKGSDCLRPNQFGKFLVKLILHFLEPFTCKHTMSLQERGIIVALSYYLIAKSLLCVHDSLFCVRKRDFWISFGNADLLVLIIIF